MTDAASRPTGEPPLVPRRPDELTRWQAVWRQVPLLVGLVVLWVFLWDHVDVLTITTGVVLAIAVTRTLYLPPVLLSGRFDPWRGLLLGLRMMFDVAVASMQVAFRAIRPGWQPTNAIMAVQLLTRSDLVTTLTAEAISVVPGTVVLDIDRERGLLYLHALATPTPEDLDRVRRHVIGTEERIVLAIGTREQAAAVREARRRRRANGGRSSAPEPLEVPPHVAREIAPEHAAPRHPLDERTGGAGDPDHPEIDPRMDRRDDPADREHRKDDA